MKEKCLTFNTANNRQCPFNDIERSSLSDKRMKNV